MSEILTDAERGALMPSLREWSLVPERDAIHKRFAFRDFDQAFAFMTRVAAIAREMDHHPDWANRYRFVDVTLWTHAAGGLTRRDIDLAAAMDRLESEILSE